jgi:hypothetical protein
VNTTSEQRVDRMSGKEANVLVRELEVGHRAGVAAAEERLNFGCHDWNCCVLFLLLSFGNGGVCSYCSYV